MHTSPYRCEAVSVEGFIQQLAVSYVSHGYYFYVAGSVPEHKDPHAVDRKLIDRYGIAISKWTRSRRKRVGDASLQYIRYRRFFLLLATHGKSRFFDEEQQSIRDCRRVPIKCFGYAVSSKNGHAHVRIEKEEFKRLKAHLIEVGLHRRGESVAKAFRSVPFEPFAPVRRQLLLVWRHVNRARKAAGFEPVPVDCIRMKRRIVEPFSSTEQRATSEVDGEIVTCDTAAPL